MSLTFDVPRGAVAVPEEPLARPANGGKSRVGDESLRFIRALWSWIQKVQVRRARKRLRLCESVPLGEKRFVAVVQVDDREFLIAGASNSVSMLTELSTRSDFSAILADRAAGSELR
jgi:hypothetical protein